MALRYHYTKASLAGVSTALSTFFEKLETEQHSFGRAANYNLIVPLSSAAGLEKLEDVIDAFSLVHASRFLVLYRDDSLAQISAEVSARCHALSKTEHVCSEIIRIGYPSKALQAVPSLVRANLLTGKTTEFYIHDAAVELEALKLFAGLCDNVIFDSSDFETSFGTIAEISSLTRSLLDLQWVGLGIWRDEIKDLFSRPLVRDYVSAIRSVEITAHSSGATNTAASALLLSAWIFDRLKLARGCKLKGNAFECAAPAGQALRISLHKTRSAGASGLSEVLFRFDPLRIGAAPQDQYIRIAAAERLETMVDLNISYRTTRPLDDESRVGRIRRYFLIGESVANYTSALNGALRLSQLKAV